MFLETIINKTILYYAHNQIAIFHKNSLPIKFTKINKECLKPVFQKAWISKKSTVDYYGVYQGIFVGFEVKSTNNDKIYLKTIKKHQANYLAQIKFHQAISFYLIGFENVNRYFIIDFEIINNWSKKSLNLNDAFEFGYEIKWQWPGILDFISALNLLIKKCP